MTTARTHKFPIVRGGTARPIDATEKPEDFTPVSAETFLGDEQGFATIAGDQSDPSDLDYDPADHTVDEVKEYVTEHPEHAEAILELEENGKARSGVMSFIENLGE